MIPARFISDHLRDEDEKITYPIHDQASDTTCSSNQSSPSSSSTSNTIGSSSIDHLTHHMQALQLDQPVSLNNLSSIPTRRTDQNGTFTFSSTSIDPNQPPHRSISPKDKGKSRALDVIPEMAIPDGMELYYRAYRSEADDMEDIMRLVEQELSEPYNIYTFRYFLIDWPHLAFLVFPSALSRNPIGVIVCKQDSHRNRTNRGYIAMLSVDKTWRRRGIASRLISLAMEEMTRRGAHEIVLETEYDNATSLALYESLGFMREKRLHRFYSNGKDAFRLIYALPHHPYLQEESDDEAEYGRWEVGSGPEWLESLTEEEATMRGLGGPVGWGTRRTGNGGGHPGSQGRPGTPSLGKPDLPPRPGDWDGMYT